MDSVSNKAKDSKAEVVDRDTEQGFIRVYKFENNGMGGPTEKSIEAILEDVRGELENWAHPEFGDDRPITLTITTGFMKRSEYEDLPEFEGY